MSVSAGRQGGLAIIAALIVVLAASAMATAVIQRQGVLADFLITERNRAQAQWLLRGGLDWSRLILRIDAQRNAATRLDGLWTHPVLDLPVGRAEAPGRMLLSGQIEDEQGKFNLARLAQGGRIEARALAALEGMLRQLRIDPTLAAVMAQRVAQSQPGDDRAPTAMGLRGIDDLRLTEGFPAAVVDVLQAYLTVLPARTPLNVNTCPPEVLAAAIPGLGLAAARELLGQRDRGQWFVSRGDFFNRSRIAPGEAVQDIAVESTWFRVSGEVRVDATIMGLRALLHRDKQGPPAVRWVDYQ
ncbi:type II secretion system minor pseudopilin GspK [Castellaniella sp. GW247-6E4]|uniref:type II secretion system minor pseudopilin GspK n=1 Tax=Castellaniella sp. GW247-6E4 TaxID=3140380 RepID=UPI003315F982